MDRTTDLSAALGFVIGRIEEEAMRSGEPLTEEQRFLLSNLPNETDAPVFSTGDPEFPLHFVPRDTVYERLCALAKAAHRCDLALNPRSKEWEFAFNVSKLNRHPMCWLLQWAGVKQRRPWWDRWLLVAASLLFIIASVPLMLLVVDKGWVLWRWAVGGAGYIGLVLLMRLASQRIEERQLKQTLREVGAPLALSAHSPDDESTLKEGRECNRLITETDTPILLVVESRASNACL